MKKTLTRIGLVLFALFLIACGQSAIDGVYESKGGKVGIYDMSTMIIEKNTDGAKYKVIFSGTEKTITYENVEYKDGELKISDKGFLMPVKLDGKKAVVLESGAVFEKSDNPKPPVTPPAKTPEPAPAATAADAKAAYPDALIGKWARDNGDKSCADAMAAEKQTGMWDGLEVQKEGVSGMEFSCTPSKVVSADGSFTIQEDCAAEGNEFKVTNVYKLSNQSLQLMTDNGSGQQTQTKFRSCK